MKKIAQESLKRIPKTTKDLATIRRTASWQLLFRSLASLKSWPTLNVQQELSEVRLCIMFSSVQHFLCCCIWECNKGCRKLCHNIYFDIWETHSPYQITNIIMYHWQGHRNCRMWTDDCVLKHRSQRSKQFITCCFAESAKHTGWHWALRSLRSNTSLHKGNIVPSPWVFLENENCHWVLPLRLNVIQ